MNLRILFIYFLLNFSVNAQVGTGQWRMHVAAKKAVDVATGNNRVVCGLETGVLLHYIAEKESKIYDATNGLSDVSVAKVAYEIQSKSFVIGYQNGNLDILNANDGVVNVPGIVLASVSGSKKINQIKAHNGLVYVATGFGIVVLNPAKQEIKDTYFPTQVISEFIDISFNNDSIYVMTEDKVYRASLQNNLLADYTNWTVDSRFTINSLKKYNSFVFKNNVPYVLEMIPTNGGDTLFKYTSTGKVAVSTSIGFDLEAVSVEFENNKLFLNVNNGTILFDENDAFSDLFADYFNASSSGKAAVFSDNYFWLADNEQGLIKAINPFGYERIDQSGPVKNYYFSLNAYKDKLCVATGGFNRVTSTYLRQGVQVFEEEKWSSIDYQNQPFLANSTDSWEISSVAINPKDIKNLVFGTKSPNGMIEVKDGIAVSYINASNSALELIPTTDNVCVANTEFDEEGNLWVSNCYTPNPLKVRSAAGIWTVLPTGSFANGAFTSEMAIDYDGNVYIGVFNKGLVGYKANGTIDNTADDKVITLSKGIGQGNLPENNVTALAVDFDNELWIGTSDGLGILYSANQSFEEGGNKEASQPLINVDGGTYVLLNGINITDIEIDGGNRKWIGTRTNGIILLSADGQEIIAEYTTENSGLISNEILDMEFNHTTGELFIITDKGLVSFRSDASYEDEKYETTKVFPNPVEPTFLGPITIQGIRYNSDVKVTDISGNLVFKTTSNGGTATWNGKTSTGENVVGGVYLIWTATNEGKFHKTGKVVVIR